MKLYSWFIIVFAFSCNPCNSQGKFFFWLTKTPFFDVRKFWLRHVCPMWNSNRWTIMLFGDGNNVRRPTVVKMAANLGNRSFNWFRVKRWWGFLEKTHLAKPFGPKLQRYSAARSDKDNSTVSSVDLGRNTYNYESYILVGVSLDDRAPKKKNRGGEKKTGVSWLFNLLWHGPPRIRAEIWL